MTIILALESQDGDMSIADIKNDASGDVSHPSKQTTALLSERVRLLEAVIDNFPGGILLFDKKLKLVLCNGQQKRLLDYPDNLFADGSPSLEQIFLFNAERGEYGPGNIDDLVNIRMDLVARKCAHVFERKRPNGTVLEIRGMPIAEGGFVTTYLDVTEQRKGQALVEYLATHDQLTELPNRTLLLDRLQVALAGSRRGSKIALHYIDLDGFKPINDKHGHTVGDLVLKNVARRMRSTIRETDTVARVGGDEFVIIQAEIESAEDADVLARRIVASVSGACFGDDEAVSVGASIGIALAPWDGNSPDELLLKADQALYRSKAGGGGAINFFSRCLNSEAHDELQSQHSLNASQPQELFWETVTALPRSENA